MKISFFPGCTLKTKASGFEKSLLATTHALGLDLEEMSNWNCCGATFPLLVDNALDLAGPARILAEARQRGSRLAVACTTCYNVLRRTNYAIRSDASLRDKLNFFIEAEYGGDLQVFDVLQILRDEIGFDTVRRAVIRPLTGLRVAAYYGCMVLRPPREVAYEEDPENPRALDDLIRAMGAEPVTYPHKSECCGAYLIVKSPAMVATMCGNILDAAAKAGADAVITNCPVCQFNLDRQQSLLRPPLGFPPLPILYYSQFLGLALGLNGTELGLETHHIDPRPLLAKIGLVV